MFTPRRALVASLAGGVLVLSGCSSVDSGQAAVSDTFRISQAKVDAQASEVATGMGEPPAVPPPGLASAITQRLVQHALVEAQADKVGVSLTAAEVEQGMKDLTDAQGGHDQLIQAALQAGIPESQLTSVVRTNLLLTRMSTAAGGTSDDQATSADVQQQIVDLSEALDVRVSPRYGTWDSATLSIVSGSPVVAPSTGSGSGAADQ